MFVALALDVVTQAVAQPVIAVSPPLTPTVEITNLVSTAVQAVGVMLLTAVAAWLRNHLNNKQAQQTVLTAAENAVAYAENRMGVKGDEPYTVPVASSIGRLALGYMNTHVGTYVKQLGLDDASLSRIIIAKMPDIKGDGIDEGTFNGIVASASGKPPAPVDYSQLLKVFGPMISSQIDLALAARTAAAPAKPATILDKPAPVPEVGKPEP